MCIDAANTTISVSCSHGKSPECGQSESGAENDDRVSHLRERQIGHLVFHHEGGGDIGRQSGQFIGPKHQLGDTGWKTQESRSSSRNRVYPGLARKPKRRVKSARDQE